MRTQQACATTNQCLATLAVDMETVGDVCGGHLALEAGAHPVTPDIVLTNAEQVHEQDSLVKNN